MITEEKRKKKKGKGEREEDWKEKDDRGGEDKKRFKGKWQKSGTVKCADGLLADDGRCQRNANGVQESDRQGHFNFKRSRKASVRR